MRRFGALLEKNVRVKTRTFCVFGVCGNAVEEPMCGTRGYGHAAASARGGVALAVSRHDSSGAAGEKAPAADADAEQIAPTAITPTGAPPASPCAETLREAVL